MSEKPLLLPTPRLLSMQDGVLNLADGKLIVLDTVDGQALIPTAVRLQKALFEWGGVAWDAVAGTAVPHDQAGVILSVTPGSVQNADGYNLTITAEGVHIVANRPAGVFYGVQTLVQLLQQYGGDLPILRINDWPDFPNRGVMLDISRDKVPTMETLYGLVDMFASWKINQLQLYTEHTFAYRNHPVVWADASPMTGEQILELDAYCRDRFIELVPNQNSFGHMRRWLIHDEYNHLAECPDGCDTDWGYYDEPFSLYQGDPDSLELVRSMFDELLPHFSSQQLNVGCDETVDLGNGRSKALVKELGNGRVYLNFLLKIYREVKARGRTMQFWGDIIVKHPDLVAELPRDLIALEWGYEADHPFDEHGAIFAQSGIPFYVCPGTCTWVTIAGRTENAMGNLLSAAENGLKHGAIGYLNTDWGDLGHWQTLPISYTGFAYGAGLSWCVESNREMDVPAALSRFAFRDEAGQMGQLAYELGDVHLETGVPVFNSTVLARFMLYKPEKLKELREGWLKKGEQAAFEPEKFRQTAVTLDAFKSGLQMVNMQRLDADQIVREFRLAIKMLQHGCHRAAWIIEGWDGKTDEVAKAKLLADAEQIIAEYEVVWNGRNRSGGLKDSVARLEKMKSDYATLS
ncbi:beta-glycosyl hydrolase [hydrothermal vent metagenome]|uniref:Beta-glycosyl hydrolase n=1 Tax=hydrothermal vent metagenome TaxID=652676 RepID=A0A3B0VYZ4_9ZZZZ